MARNRLSKLPRIKVIPGKPAIEGQKGGCVTVTEIVGWKQESGGSGSSGSYTVIYPPPMPPQSGAEPGDFLRPPNQNPIIIPDWQVSGPSSPGGRVPIYKERQECWPEIPYTPGIPSRLVEDYSSWYGGARSLDSLSAGRGFSVDISKDPVAIVIGATPERMSHDYAGFESGVVLRSTGVREISNGVEGEEVPLDAKRLIIFRSKDSVTYTVSGRVIAERSVQEQEKLYIYVMLYAAGDYIQNPYFFILPDAVAEVRLESLLETLPGGVSELKIQALGDIFQSGMSVMRLESLGEPMLGRVTPGVTPVVDTLGHIALRYGEKGSDATGDMLLCLGSMGAAGAISEGTYAKAKGTWPPYALEAQSNIGERQTVGAYGAFSSNRFYGWALAGGVIGGSGFLPAFGKASEGDWLGGTVRVYQSPTAGGWIDEQPDGAVLFNDLVRLGALFELDSAILFGFTEGVSCSDSIDIYLLVSMAFHEAVLADDGMTFGGVIELLINEGLSVSPASLATEAAEDGSTLPPAMRESLQYAVNATTGALSRYKDFGFSQFAYVGGTTYAITDDGLYRLGGDSDAGNMLSAAIDFGATDYGTAQGKRVGSVYAGIATDGQVYIRMTADDGVEQVYRAVSYNSESRAQTAKGVVARHWRLRLELMDASYADLDNVEIEVGVSQRRLGRR